MLQVPFSKYSLLSGSHCLQVPLPSSTYLLWALHTSHTVSLEQVMQPVEQGLHVSLARKLPLGSQVLQVPLSKYSLTLGLHCLQLEKELEEILFEGLRRRLPGTYLLSASQASHAIEFEQVMHPVTQGLHSSFSMKFPFGSQMLQVPLSKYSLLLGSHCLQVSPSFTYLVVASQV